MTKAEHIISTRRVLAAENLSLTSYTMMLVLSGLGPGGRTSLNDLSGAVGMTYHATRHQLRRTPWFEVDWGGQAGVRVGLAPEGAVKLMAVERKVAGVRA